MDRHDIEVAGMNAYSAKTLAERWGCSKTHVYARIRSGELRHFKFGTLIRIPKDEVERIEAGECGSNYTGDGGMPSGGKMERPSEKPWKPWIAESRKGG